MLDADSGLNIIDDSHNHGFPSCGIQLLIVLGRTKELLEIKNKNSIEHINLFHIFSRNKIRNHDTLINKHTCRENE